MRRIFKAGNYVDALWLHEAIEDEIAERAKLPGATFTSAYGPAIFEEARTRLSNRAFSHELSSREKSAAWPEIFLDDVMRRTAEPLARSLPELPAHGKLMAEMKKAEQFKQAYEAVSGVELYGSAKLPAHKRLKIAQEVPPMLRAQARCLHVNGVCEYSDSAVKLGEKFAHAERDREMLMRGEFLRKRGALSKRRGIFRDFVR